MQSKGLSSVVHLVPLGCSSRLFRPPFLRPFANKKRAPLKGEALFLLSAFPVFTRSLPSFGRATTSTIPLHFVTLRRLRFTTFQQYNAWSPIFLQRLLARSAIRVAPLSLCPKSRYALRLLLIFFLTLHAHICYVSLRSYTQLSHLWWHIVCRKIATALLIRNKKFFAWKRHHFFFLLAVLGDFREYFHNARSARKKIKKESKFKLRFQKVKFKPSGFLNKSPPLHFQIRIRM